MPGSCIEISVAACCRKPVGLLARCAQELVDAMYRGASSCKTLKAPVIQKMLAQSILSQPAWFCTRENCACLSKLYIRPKGSSRKACTLASHKIAETRNFFPTPARSRSLTTQAPRSCQDTDSDVEHASAAHLSWNWPSSGSAAVPCSHLSRKMVTKHPIVAQHSRSETSAFEEK